MRDSGLIDWWSRRFSGSERCVIEDLRRDSLRPHFFRLRMSNLQGPFAVLVCGFVLATLSWIGEMIVFLCHRF